MNSGAGRVVRFVFSSIFGSLLGCSFESLTGDDCTSTFVGVVRATAVGLGVGAFQDGLAWLMKRLIPLWREMIGCPRQAEAVDMEPVVIGNTPNRNPIARYTPRLEDAADLPEPIDRLNPADFEQAFEMEGAPEIGTIATGAGEAAAAEGAAAGGVFASLGATAAEAFGSG